MKRVIVTHKLILDWYNTNPEGMKNEVIFQMLVKLAKEMYDSGMVKLTENETKMNHLLEFDSKDFEMTAFIATEDELIEILSCIDTLSKLVPLEGLPILKRIIQIIKT